MKAIVAIFEQLVPISGGGTPRTAHIVRALARRGHEVHVAASFGAPPGEAQQELDCAKILSLPLVSRLDRHKMLKYLLVYPWSVVRLAVWIWRIKPDLVVSHNTVAGFGALLGQRLSPHTVTVLDLTDLLFEYLGSYRKRWMSLVLSFGRGLERNAIRHSDLVVTISEAMRTILVKDYQAAAERIVVVHDGVDCALFHPQDCASLRQRVSPWAEDVCVFHGVIDPQDGPETLLEATPMVLERFPNAAFWWVGDGAAVPGLKARAEQMGLTDHFFFTGWVAQRKVAEYINASDLGIVVLPDILSARGRVTLKEFEYWACGKAAILPNLPALREIVADGAASLFFSPGDAIDLARAICTLLEDKPRRMLMGERGRDIVREHYDWPVLAKQFVRLSEEQVASSSSARSCGRLAGGSA